MIELSLPASNEELRR